VAAQGGGRSPPVALFWFREKGFVAVGKWETCFWFSTFPSACFPPELWKCGISPVLGEIPKGLWKQGEACFWLSTVSIGPSFPQLSSAFYFSGFFAHQFSLHLDALHARGRHGGRICGVDRRSFGTLTAIPQNAQRVAS
jgi:hypothetical protein